MVWRVGAAECIVVSSNDVVITTFDGVDCVSSSMGICLIDYVVAMCCTSMISTFNCSHNNATYPTSID